MKLLNIYRNSLKARIILPAIFVLIALSVILSMYSSLKFIDYNEKIINDKSSANIYSLRSQLEVSKGKSKTAAVSMALNRDAIHAIKNRDTDEILRVFAPMHDFYQVTFYTICDNEGRTLARTHDPKNFGDSVINQQNVRDAIDGKTATYFEAGTVVKVSVRTGAPVYDMDGTLIGVVSAGVRFDSNSFVDQLKRLLHSEATIFYGNAGINTTFMREGIRATGITLDPAIAKTVINARQEFSGEAEYFGKPYKTFYEPLLNANEETFATLFIGTPLTELRAMAGILVWDWIIIGCIGLAISIMVLYMLLSSVSRPLIMLSDNMNNVAAGNLNIDVAVKTDCEVGQLGKSSQKMIHIMRKLINDINVTIREYEKGNTVPCIDINEFHGDYRELAGRIIELAGLGAMDQLTKIPNRRCFDNRLGLEWTRAMRQMAPLSVLMLDVDNFKNYNDTFGHLQGDLALQTVAGVFPQVLKRGPDFYARWGGEEFAVLLPDTDSDGARNIAEGIRMAVENALIPSPDEKAAKVTVSIGISTLVPTQSSSIDHFIAQADEALYKAKEAGRNRTVTA